MAFPTYQQDQTTRPLPTPYGNAQHSPDEFGAALGGALEQAAGVAQHIAEKAKADADTTAVIAAMGQAQKAYNDQIADEVTGYSSLRGDAAIAKRDEAIKKYDETLKEISGSLTDRHQKNAFDQHALVLQSRARGHIETHFAQQAEIYSRTKFDGTQQEQLRTLAQPGVVGSPIERDRVFMDVARVAAAEAVRRGEDPAMLVGHAKEAATRTMLDQLLAGKNPNLIEAAKVMGKYSDTLGDHRARYEKVLQDATDVRQADSEAIRITAESMGKDGQVDRRKAQGLIDQLAAGPMKDSVQQRVDHRANIFDQAWKDEATNLAAKVIEQARDPVTGELSLATVNPKDMSDLQLKWPTKANELRKGVAIEGAKERYASAIEHFFGPESWQNTARMTPAEFLTDSNVVTLPAKHRTALIERYQAMQKRIGVAPPESVVVEEARKALGLGSTGKIGSLSDEKKAAFGNLYEAVKNDVRDWSINNSGAHPDREKVREFTRNELEVVRSEWFGFSKTRRYQTAPAAKVKASGVAPSIEQLLPLPPPTGQIRVKAPDGTEGFIPAAQRDAAVKAGYSIE